MLSTRDLDIKKLSRSSRRKLSTMAFSPERPLVVVGPYAHKISLWEKFYNFTAKTPFYIFVDAGSRYRSTQRKGLSVGDGDSFSLEKLDLRLNPNKNFSDLQFALSLIPNNCQDIYLFGFLGGRRDHEWANLGEVQRFLKKRTHRPTLSVIYWDLDWRVISSGPYSLTHRGLFSLLALEKTIVTLTGKCRYSLLEKTILHPFSSLGISNIASGKIFIESSSPLFIYTPV